MPLGGIIVGSASDEFVKHTTKLLREREIEFVLCESIYMAVVELVESTGRNTIVVGRFERLNAEKGQFFQKLHKAGHTCCCLADRNSPRLRKIGTDITVVNEFAEIEAVIEKMLERDLKSLGKKRAALIKDDFITTKAELDALLGV